MRGGVIHQASGVRPSKSLVVRGGLVRTFGSLAGFLVVTLSLLGDLHPRGRVSKPAQRRRRGSDWRGVRYHARGHVALLPH